MNTFLCNRRVSILLKDLRTRLMCSLLNSKELVTLKNASVDDVSFHENGNSGGSSLPPPPKH